MQAAVETEDSQKERRADAENVVRINTDLVVCDVMVLDKQGHAVSGLTKDDFAVSEDDKVQQVAHFSLGSNATGGRSIVLITDYSGSLAPYINLSVDAAKTFIEKLNPNDRVAIVTNEVTLLVNFTSDKSRLKKALESLKITALTHKGNSYQFSALLATARELFDEEDIRPIIIFQTDGDQVDFLQPPDPSVLHSSIRSRIVQFGLDDVYAAVEKSRATVYTVIPGFRLIGLPEAEQLKRAEMDAERVVVANGMGGDYLSRQPYHPSKKVIADNLDFRLRGQMAAAEVAKLSGGWTSFLEEPEQAEAIYSSILLDINNRYIVGYYPTNKTHDGKRRKLLVEVRNHPEYSVWGRKSYIAPQPDPQP
ncbi:MAG TPA: VWA domain-containing protein [Pyrinomonadaceae bacterium]|nr:VWA domain-containing protein [Pyrinomonadaceae bacterium]